MMIKLFSAIFLITLTTTYLSAQAQTHDLSTDKIISETYSYQILQSSSGYVNKTGDFTFFSETDFVDFCNANFGLDSKIPFIDFNTETAVIIFKATGNKDDKIFIDSSIETEHYIKLNLKTTQNNQTVSKSKQTQYLIVKVKKSNKEIRVIRW